MVTLIVEKINFGDSFCPQLRLNVLKGYDFPIIRKCVPLQRKILGNLSALNVIFGGNSPLPFENEHRQPWSHHYFHSHPFRMPSSQLQTQSLKKKWYLAPLKMKLGNLENLWMLISGNKVHRTPSKITLDNQMTLNFRNNPFWESGRQFLMKSPMQNISLLLQVWNKATEATS